MLIVAADNLWLALPVIADTTVAYTDPYPLNGNDRASAILTVAQIYGGADDDNDRVITFRAETSLDGVNWAESGLLGESHHVTSSSNPPTTSLAPVFGAYIRFKFVFEVTTVGSDTAGVLFSLYVNLDKS